jgi:hypothetical protein
MSTVPDRLRERAADVATTLTAGATAEEVDTARWVGALSVLLVAAGSILALGPLGALAGAAVVSCWYASSPETTFALGALLLTIVGTPSTGIALAGLGLLGVLLSPLFRVEEPRRALTVFVAFLAICLVVAGLGLAWVGTAWGGALGLAIWVACVAYGLHRYSLLATGVLGSTDPEEGDGSGAVDPDTDSSPRSVDPNGSVDRTGSTASSDATGEGAQS